MVEASSMRSREMSSNGSDFKSFFKIKAIGITPSIYASFRKNWARPRQPGFGYVQEDLYVSKKIHTVTNGVVAVNKNEVRVWQPYRHLCLSHPIKVPPTNAFLIKKNISKTSDEVNVFNNDFAQ